MKLTAEDVLTPKQLEALAFQSESKSYCDLGITNTAFKRRLTRARRILESIGIDPQWKRKQ